MFYVLAKILWLLAQPSSLIVGAVLAGAALAGTKWRRLARTLSWGGGLALVVGGLSPLGDMLTRPLEYRIQPAGIDGAEPSIAGIIVLGGGEDPQAAGAPQVAALNEAAERYTEAVALARRLPGARLVFSGASGRLLKSEKSEPPEAGTAARLFEALGVAKDRITLETASRDTYENALFTARMLKPKPGERWLLVTSAWHMPRAMGCFRRVGFAVEAWPVDYRSPRRLDLTRMHTSIPEGLRRIDFVVREYVGLAAYYLTGRTGALYPGP